MVIIRGVGRVWVALDNLERYQSLAYTPPIALYVGYNLMWSLAFAGLLLSMWHGRLMRWYLWGGLIGLMVADTLWALGTFPENYERTRLPFVGLVWLLLFSILYLMIRREAFASFATRRK
jgi:hypothetical protein